MKPIKLIIKTNTQQYPIFIGSSLISKISLIMSSCSINSKNCLLIIDKNVPRKLINKIKKSLKNKKIFSYNIDANEKNKSYSTVNSILMSAMFTPFFS